MATISNTPRPGYIFDSTDNCWYPIGTGTHSHGEVPLTTIDAKGDLIAGTANDTVTKLTAGSDGSILVTDSTQTTGLKWALGAPISTNAQTASYTLVLGDAYKLVEISNASANTLTVPLNSSVAFPTGTQITILQTGAGQTTVAGTGGVTVNGTPGLKLRAQWSSATLIKRGTDTWVLIGDVTA